MLDLLYLTINVPGSADFWWGVLSGGLGLVFLILFVAMWNL